MRLSVDELVQLSDVAIGAARQAGQLIQEYSGSDVAVEQKEGVSLASQVVTEVDRKSQRLILEQILPACEPFDLALLTEESVDDCSRFEKEYFWCIDPLDSTLSFVEGRPGYAVSIALVTRAGRPQLGVVYDPVRDIMYQAVTGQGALRNGVPWKPAPTGNVLTFTYDRSLKTLACHDALMEGLELLAGKRGLEGIRALQHGGAVLNAILLLEEGPGCYIKLPRIQVGGGSLWDYAATACLFQEVGATATDIEGQPLDLNRSDSTYMNHRGALYASDMELAGHIREMVRGLS